MKFGLLPLSAVLVCSTLTASDERAGAPQDLLDRAREANQQLYSDLESFVCNEEMVRYKGPLGSATGRQIDTVSTRVSFENGEEHYTLIRRNNSPRGSISSLDGAWSEGEYGTLLRQTQLLLQTQPVTFLRNEEVEGAPAALFAFDVPETESPWDLAVAGQHFRVPFRSDVWVSRDSGQIVKIERRSTTLSSASRVSEVRWSVVLAPVDMNGRSWLLPRSGEYSVSYEEAGEREWNVMQFSNYHRYGSEASLRFEPVQ